MPETQSRINDFVLKIATVNGTDIELVSVDYGSRAEVTVVVNKMDLVGYSQETYDQIVEDFKDFCVKLNIRDISFIPAETNERGK